MIESDELIDRISKAGDRYGDLLIEFLERYNLQGLHDATVAQLKEFIADKAI